MAIMSLTTLAKFTLPLFSIAGYYCTWIFSEESGYFAMARQVRDRVPQYLPGTEAPIKLVYTGIRYPIDHYLSLLATLFWPVVDGSSPHLSLQAFQFAFQFMALWTVFEMETRRLGNKGRVISFLVIWGILMQVIGLTVIVPIYLALYLWTSPLGLDPAKSTASSSTADMLVDIADLQVLPISMLLGYAAPVALMSLRSPDITSFDTHQILMSAWQVFPLSVGVLQALLRPLASGFLPPRTKYRSALERDVDMLRHLRAVYIFAFACSAISHIAALTLSVSSVLLPQIFHPRIASHFHPRRVFVPDAAFGSAKVASMGDGLLNFLLYDEYIGCLATITWAVVMHRNARKAERTWAESAALLMKMGALTLVGGPVSVVVWLLWERDEFVLGTGRTEMDKKTT